MASMINLIKSDGAVCRACREQFTHCSCTDRVSCVAFEAETSAEADEVVSNDLCSDSDFLSDSLFFICDYHDVASINRYINSNINNPNLFLIHFNIRSLQKNFDSLVNYISQLNKTPDVIAITETKLTEGAIYTDIHISGYNFIHVDSITNAGGVGMYIKNSYSFHEMKTFNIKVGEVESIWIQIESVD